MLQMKVLWPVLKRD